MGQIPSKKSHQVLQTFAKKRQEKCPITKQTLQQKIIRAYPHKYPRHGKNHFQRPPLPNPKRLHLLRRPPLHIFRRNKATTNERPKKITPQRKR